jgi:hypothetical protein
VVLSLQRKRLTTTSTIGELYIGDETGPFCYTLEDAVREQPGVPVPEWKIPGKTAIPSGSYDLVIDMSARFKRLMPHLLDVPGFEGIRIHPGNTESDTEGCILVGKTRMPDRILHSKDAFDDLFRRLQAVVDKGEPIRITISG